MAVRHAAALNAIGLHAAVADDTGAAAPAAASLLFDAQPSGQSLMQSLPALQRRWPAPLCGAHVLLAVAAMAHSAAEAELRAGMLA